MKMQISFNFENFRFAFNEDANQFYGFEKDMMISRFLKQKKVNLDNKDIKNMFQQKYINST